MGPRLLASRYAVMMDAADTSITWPLILLIRDADSVSVWWMNAWRAYAGPGSSGSLSWWPTIIRAAVAFGVAVGGRTFRERSLWESMSKIIRASRTQIDSRF